ncbi:MAG: hypothetical protein ABI691_02935 [Ginsengibacter sp.]
MKKQKDKQPSKDNSKSRSTCCANCPLHCVAVFELNKSAINLNTVYKKAYSPIKSYVLAGYVPGTWKPPNNI